MLDPMIAARLTADDDPALWDVATSAILADAAQIAGDAKEDVFAQVGCCKHWIRPHGMRWPADCGFAWPAGYDKTVTGFFFSALPELEWSVTFKRTGDAWEVGRTGARCLLFRIAIPGRSARHLQAAVHTVWTPRSPLTTEKVVQLYGFRKKDGTWQLTATETLRRRKK